MMTCQAFCVYKLVPPAYTPTQLKNSKKKITTRAAGAIHGTIFGFMPNEIVRPYPPDGVGLLAASGSLLGGAIGAGCDLRGGGGGGSGADDGAWGKAGAVNAPPQRGHFIVCPEY